MESHCSGRQIEKWLDSLCGSPPVPDTCTAIPPTTTTPGWKRKLSNMERDSEATPKAKVTKTIGLQTPSGSIESLLFSAARRGEPTSRASSTTTSSRGSSPSERRREAEAEFSVPAIRHVSENESMQWKESNSRNTPLFQELLDEISKGPMPEEQASPTGGTVAETEVIAEIRECNGRDANEEIWSDNVVLPMLRLARTLSKCENKVEIINVKLIDVWPASLLPSNVQNDSIAGKRVDYSLGVEVADKDTIYDVLERIEDHTIALSNNRYLRDRALYSHIEIKTEGKKREAQTQLAVWCAAAFCKQERMWFQTQRGQPPGSHTRLPPIPLWLWQGQTVRLLVAVKDSATKVIRIQEEDIYTINTKRPETLRDVLHALAGVMRWGEKHYRQWFIRSFIRSYDAS